MSKSLLIDAMPIKLSLDEGGEDGKVIARGEFARCDVPTQNGRKYSRALYEREVAKLQENIKRRRMFGELDHPADGKTMLNRVSHIVTKLEVADDGRVIGEAEILDTPSGKTLKAILSAGAEAGVSSRGFGSTKSLKDGSTEVGDDFVLRTFDFVADPAMMTAYPDIFTEDVDQPEFTVDDLAASFPELVEEAAQRSAKDSIDEILDQERARITAEMEEQFATRLADSLSGLRESMLEDVRQEYESDNSTQAHVAIHKIAEILSPMIASPDSDTLSSALRAEEERSRDLEAQLAEAKDMVTVAGYAIHVESRLGAHPMRDKIKRLLGKVSFYESLDDLNVRLDEIIEDFEVVVAAERQTEAVSVAGLEEEVESLRAAYNDLQESHADLSNQAESLMEQNERLKGQVKRAEVGAYKRQKTAAHTNSQELLSLLESADSRDQVDRLVEQYGQSQVSDPSLETLRQRVRRGNLRQESAVIEEGVQTPNNALDVSFSEIKALAGLN
jgi:hypothetical protein